MYDHINCCTADCECGDTLEVKKTDLEELRNELLELYSFVREANTSHLSSFFTEGILTRIDSIDMELCNIIDQVRG